MTLFNNPLLTSIVLAFVPFGAESTDAEPGGGTSGDVASSNGPALPVSEGAWP